MTTENSSHHRTTRMFRGYGGVLLAAFTAACLLKLFVIDAVVIPSPSMESTLLPGDFVLINKLVYGSGPGAAHDGGPSASSFLHLPGLRDVRRGDVVVFELPQGAEVDGKGGSGIYVKRCAGVSGDVIRIEHGLVFVNDIRMQVTPDSSIPDRPPFRIPRRGDTISLSSSRFGQWAPLIHGEGHRAELAVHSILIDGRPAASYIVQRDYCFVLGDNPRHSYDGRWWGLLPLENITGQALMIYWSLDPAKPLRSLTDFTSSIRWDRIGTLVR